MMCVGVSHYAAPALLNALRVSQDHGVATLHAVLLIHSLTRSAASEESARQELESVQWIARV